MISAALAMAAIGSLGVAAQAPVRTSANQPRPRRVAFERMNAQQREIAEWNDAVEAKRQAKRARKLPAPAAGEG
jgi:hypothetical protein